MQEPERLPREQPVAVEQQAPTVVEVQVEPELPEYEN